MSDGSRLRGVLVMLAVFVPVTVVATASTPENRLFTAVTMSATFLVLIVIVMASWRFRPAWLVAGTRAMEVLDPAERLQVTQAVRSGEVVADPRLAGVATVVAAGTARVAWLTIAVGGFNLAVRAWSLAVDRESAPPLLLDLLSAAIFLGVLTYGSRQLLHARRAAQANGELATAS